MNCKYLFIAMILFASCSTMGKKNQPNDTIVSDTISSRKNSPNDGESEYLSVRNNYVEHLQTLQKAGKNIDSLIKLDNEALSDLENRLRFILKESHFSGQGKINLETLLGFLGFGMLDGLTFEKDSMRIFYTSKNIFLDYFKEEKISQLNNLTEKNLENIFQNTFVNDAHLSNYGSIRIQTSESIQAFGMVGMACQMIGPWPPEYLYVFLSRDNYIYMCEKHLNKPIRDLHSCRLIYDNIYQESEKQLEIYHSSNLKDTIAFNNHTKLWEEAMVKYCDCYQKELKNDSQFEDIKRQIEDLVKFLAQEKN